MTEAISQMTSRLEAGEAVRVPLTRERVLGAAIELADAVGIDALTMRRLAQALGVEAMSLYHHVANKDDLLLGMLDVVVQEMELPDEDLPWKVALRRSAISAHEVLVRHRWAGHLLVSGDTGVARSRLQHMDAILGSLRRGGFSVALTDHAYHALDSHIIGFTMWQLSFPFETDEELRAVASDFLHDFPVDQLPYLAEHVAYHLREPSGDEQGEFDFGLDLILDGLERAQSAASA